MVLRRCRPAPVALVFFALASVLVALIGPPVRLVAASGAWPAPLASSSALALAGAAPSAPTGVTSACASVLLSSDITVTWGAVAHATGYTVLQSTTSAATGFTAVVTGVASTTWTTGSLALGTYYYEVVADAGAHWSSPASSATAGIAVVSVVGIGLACA